VNNINKLKFLHNNRDLFESTSREKMYWFFREQFRFGHREILLEYVGKSLDNLIVGFLQHGTDIGGNWPYQELPQNLKKNFPAYVWSSVAEERARESGRNQVRAIGSPWLYLLETNGITPFDSNNFSSSQSRRDFLIVPSHGSGHSHASSNYEDVPRTFRELIGDASATALLYYTEFCDSSIRSAWAKYGFPTTCNGMAWGAEARTVWTYNGGRPHFLRSAMALISDHANVICSSPTTFAYYSLSLGVPTQILSSHDLPAAMGIVSEGKGVERLRDYGKNIDATAEQMFGSTYSDLDCNTDKLNHAAIALGIESKLSKKDLELILTLKPNMIPLPESQLEFRYQID
jgi:hypothetical protein